MEKRGFTLIELIVVIAIIAVLAAVVAPNAFKAIDKAKISNVIAGYKNIKTAAAQYFGDVGAYPASCTDYSNCKASGFIVEPSSGADGWDGPYLDKWPVNAFTTGNVTYTYSTTGTQFNSSQASEGYVTIEGATTAAKERIDKAIDGTLDATHGSSRYNSTGVHILVTRDGVID